MADKPEFIERNASKIVSEIVAYYQAQTGKTLHPAQPERLLINAFAYRELLVRQAIQDAAVQNLVAFSTAPVLDYLGELVGVTRLPAKPATCTLRFTMNGGHGGVIIPAGTRVASTDGRVIFATRIAVTVPAGTTTFDVDAECETPGEVGNGFVAGEIKTILDPIANVISAANTDTTAGGASMESDENLRERIKLAPASFSTAGPRAAYAFHARSAHQSIIDVSVTSPAPGIVEVFPLVATGEETPQEVLNAVSAALNADNVRPLTDSVQVLSPEAVHYSVDVDVKIYATADPTAIQSQILANLQSFTTERRLRLGRDITESQVIALCQIEGVYSVTLNDWTDVEVDHTQFPVCDDIEVNVTTTSND